jgi:hypothetical protein
MKQDAEIQGIHKRLAPFQMLIKNLFRTLYGHNILCQQQEPKKVFMPHQPFASLAYCVAAGPVAKMASQQEKAFCILRFEVSRSIITVQREFRARFKKDTPHNNNVFLNRARNSCSTNHICGHLKTEHTGSILLLQRHLGNWSRGSAISMTSKLLIAHEILAQFPLLTIFVVRTYDEK